MNNAPITQLFGITINSNTWKKLQGKMRLIVDCKVRNNAPMKLPSNPSARMSRSLLKAILALGMAGGEKDKYPMGDRQVEPEEREVAEY